MLDLELQPPTVTFETPLDGDIVSPDGLIAIRPHAVDMFGHELWTRVMTGTTDFGWVAPGDYVATTLEPGEHAIIANATDRLGMQGTPAVVKVTVPTVPATLEIVGVSEGATVDGGVPLQLIGRGRDGILY
ncbi:hypothetical protein, partial [Bradyrhizobium sp. NBAIM08]|uniref:hypothetical protein n=1 Tax=Bradyrhizobium sp. NBAIM08 TaxID=2793815 RepID=UPI001CD57622